MPNLETPREAATVWPDEVMAVKSAIEDRDLKGVHQAFSRWLEKDPSDRYDRDYFVTCLVTAIEVDHPTSLQYLLSQDVPYHTVHVKSAIRRGSEGLLEVFLEHGWEINRPEKWDTPSLLCRAVMDEKITRWFLANGADPNAECDFDCTPLSAAVRSAPLSTIKLLFEHGGTGQHGQLIHYAASRTEADRLEVLDFILSKGAVGLNSLLHEHRPSNYKMMEAFGMGTPLHSAAAEGLLDTVQYLLAKGADPGIRNSRGGLAIDRARYQKHSDVVDFLRRYPS